MNNMGQNGEKMRYRVILLLVVALTAFSSAMKELNQVQQLALDASRLFAQWSNKVAPAEAQPAVVKAETCEMKQSAPAVELPWLAESRPAASEEMSVLNEPQLAPVNIEKSTCPLMARRARPNTSPLAAFKKFHIVNLRISSRDREMLLKLNRSISLRITS